MAPFVFSLFLLLHLEETTVATGRTSGSKGGHNVGSCSNAVAVANDDTVIRCNMIDPTQHQMS